MRIGISDEGGLNRAILQARHQAMELGFDGTVAAMVSTAVSELGRNILKYAGSGEIVVRAASRDGSSGIEVVAQDRGPGIDDIEQALSDHFSSSGTLGLGLPGVRRLAEDFEIESRPGEGTRVTFRKWRRA